MVERIVNINEYHDVFAESLRQIIGMTVVGKDDIVRELCMSNILQAYTIYVTDTPEELKKLEVELEAAIKKNKNKSVAIYDVIIERLKHTELYTSDGDLNKELTIDKLKIIMYYYLCRIGVKPTQTTRQTTHIYNRVKGELATP